MSRCKIFRVVSLQNDHLLIQNTNLLTRKFVQCDLFIYLLFSYSFLLIIQQLRVELLNDIYMYVLPQRSWIFTGMYYGQRSYFLSRKWDFYIQFQLRIWAVKVRKVSDLLWNFDVWWRQGERERVREAAVGKYLSYDFHEINFELKYSNTSLTESRKCRSRLIISYNNVAGERKKNGNSKDKKIFCGKVRNSISTINNSCDPSRVPDGQEVVFI